MSIKLCRVCKIPKQLSAFNKVTVNKDGYCNRCRECGKKYTTEYHKQQKQKNKALSSVLPKKCPKCNVIKLPEHFYKNSCSNTGLTSYCKICSSTRGKKWEKANKEKSKQRGRVDNLKRNYGLTIEDYEKMLNKQNNVCWICKTNNPGKNRSYFTVDHCHATGVVRGLLCAKCNCALGLLNDDPVLFSVAKQYLEKQYDPDLV